MEREITEPVDLCLPDGRVNPAAVGWTRTPLHRANLRRRRVPGAARTKEWEYWAVDSPAGLLALTVSDIDYGTLLAVWFRPADGPAYGRTVLGPPRMVRLPDACCGGPVQARFKGVEVEIRPHASGVDLFADAPGLHAEATVDRPEHHEAMGVVVRWDDRRFQYTVKENTLPAVARVQRDGERYVLDRAWATLDHGRGVWPRRITWNWGSGSGVVDGRTVGVQVGGRWTDGTGSTENALCLDGRIHKIGEDLVWEYSPADWMRPWRVVAPVSRRVDLTFHPDHVRVERTSAGVVSSATHQCFGTWIGTMTADDGEPVVVDGARGWAEESRQKW